MSIGFRPRAGDVFENPATRETGRILTANSDTAGRYMHAEIRTRPGGAVSVAHRHAGITERFTIVEGERTVVVDGERRALTAGEQLTVNPRVAHHYANASDADVVFRCEIWPAARFEAMVLTMFALGAEGRTDAQDRPSVLQLAVVLHEYAYVMELAGPPQWLQRLLLPVLARASRARGLRHAYPRHAEVYAGWQTRPALAGSLS